MCDSNKHQFVPVAIERGLIIFCQNCGATLTYTGGAAVIKAARADSGIETASVIAG